MPLFEEIDLFVDETARSGSEQMALDEALLESARRPLLRPYRWAEPTVTFGYAQALAQVRRRFAAWPCVRRWTGGGIVAHQGDWTFALIIPSSDPLTRVRPEEMYRLTHAGVLAALHALGCSARLADATSHGRETACFDAPVLYDVVGPDGRKFCGGAQRRTRRGILHQGSIQNLRLPGDFAVLLPGMLAAGTHRFFPEPATLARAHELVAAKYGTHPWLERL